MKNEVLKAYIAWASICIVWGTTYLAIRVGATNLPPMLFAGLRFLTASALFYLYLRIKGYPMPRKEDLLPIAIVGLSLLGVANSMVVVASQWIPSGVVALLLTTIPLWAVVIESFIPSGIKFNYKILAGVLLGLLGSFLIYNSDLEFTADKHYIMGIGCLLIAVISWASGSMYSKYKKIKSKPLVAATFQMLFAGLAQTTVGLILGEHEEFAFHNWESFAAFAYLIVIGSLLGYAAYIYSIQHLPVSFVTTYAYINPIIALFLGWLVLNEELNLLIGISAAIILIGVALVRLGSQQKKPLIVDTADQKLNSP